MLSANPCEDVNVEHCSTGDNFSLGSDLPIPAVLVLERCAKISFSNIFTGDIDLKPWTLPALYCYMCVSSARGETYRMTYRWNLCSHVFPLMRNNNHRITES